MGKFKPKPWEHNPNYKNSKGQRTNLHINGYESFFYSPVYRHLSPSAVKIYPILAIQYTERPDQKNGIIKCPYRFISEKTGMSTATISKALKELEQFGVINVKKSGGFGIPAEYQLVSKWQTITKDEAERIRGQVKGSFASIEPP